MKMATGYFDGLHIILDEAAPLARGQKVQILISNDDAASKDALRIAENTVISAAGCFRAKTPRKQ